VEGAGWVYRSQEDQDDVGVDAEIEVVDDLEVTGWLLKIQVRGRKTIRWQGDTFRMLVKRSTYNEWLTIGLPVAVIIGDVSTSELFWSIPYGVPESTDAGAKVPITFDRSRRLQADLSGLRRVIGSWRAGYVADPLSEIGPFLRIFRELEAGTGGDLFLRIDDELDEKLRLFLGHLSRLHVQVGVVRDVPMPAHSAWVKISVKAFPGGEHALHWGMFDIAIDLLRRDYFACLRQIRERVRTLLAHEVTNELLELQQILAGVDLDDPSARRDAEGARERLLHVLDAIRSDPDSSQR
jgi:hypothetical protein